MSRYVVSFVLHAPTNTESHILTTDAKSVAGLNRQLAHRQRICRWYLVEFKVFRHNFQVGLAEGLNGLFVGDDWGMRILVPHGETLTQCGVSLCVPLTSHDGHLFVGFPKSYNRRVKK